jgi:hypothetical protein
MQNLSRCFLEATIEFKKTFDKDNGRKNIGGSSLSLK